MLQPRCRRLRCLQNACYYDRLGAVKQCREQFLGLSDAGPLLPKKVLSPLERPYGKIILLTTAHIMAYCAGLTAVDKIVAEYGLNE